MPNFEALKRKMAIKSQKFRKFQKQCKEFAKATLVSTSVVGLAMAMAFAPLSNIQPMQDMEHFHRPEEVCTSYYRPARVVPVIKDENASLPISSKGGLGYSAYPKKVKLFIVLYYSYNCFRTLRISRNCMPKKLVYKRSPKLKRKQISKSTLKKLST
jgi:hypothetical protein